MCFGGFVALLLFFEELLLEFVVTFVPPLLFFECIAQFEGLFMFGAGDFLLFFGKPSCVVGEWTLAMKLRFKLFDFLPFVCAALIDSFGDAGEVAGIGECFEDGGAVAFGSAEEGGEFVLGEQHSAGELFEVESEAFFDGGEDFGFFSGGDNFPLFVVAEVVAMQ